MRWARPGRWALAAALAASGCGSGSDEAVPTEDELRRLEVLGYVDYAPEATDTPSGVVVHDESRTQPGYTFYSLQPLRRAELIDPDGHVVHEWALDAPGNWDRAYLEDGEVYAVGQEKPTPPGAKQKRPHYLARIGADGRLAWRLDLPVHHFVGPAPGGLLGVLTVRKRRLRAFPDDVVKDNGIALFDRDGEILEERSLYEMLEGRSDVLELLPAGRLRLSVDLFHSNAFQFMTRPDLARRDPIYALGNVLVTIRNQDSLVVFDWERGEAIWAWGRGELKRPHHGTVLDDGNLLVFDNRMGEGWSRVVELDPLARRIAWEYRASPPEEFYSETRGSAQRLPNGNTLIAESEEGRIFEVTREGEVVWDYRVSHRNDDGHRATVIRARRLDAELVESGILGRQREASGEGTR